MSSIEPKKQGPEFEYLGVDDFIDNALYARALAAAFELGIVDLLVNQSPSRLESLATQLRTNTSSVRLLVNLLRENRVIENCGDGFKLTDAFVHALQFRDLLELKLQIANFAAHDFLDYFTDLICRPSQVQGKVRFCRLFSYDKCIDYSGDNYELTRRWMKITTTLTKYEAGPCLKYHDFSQYLRILDIGGNSGEFVLRICKSNPQVRATVFDLPLVCDVGTQHVGSEPEAGRISFVKGNALTDELPKGFDLVTFKSILHDWPDKEAKHFISKASESLRPGGTLLIFERGPLDDGDVRLSYAAIPMLLFFHSFRAPALYAEHLKSLGFQEIQTHRIDLETPFYLVTAKRE